MLKLIKFDENRPVKKVYFDNSYNIVILLYADKHFSLFTSDVYSEDESEIVDWVESHGSDSNRVMNNFGSRLRVYGIYTQEEYNTWWNEEQKRSAEQTLKNKRIQLENLKKELGEV